MPAPVRIVFLGGLGEIGRNCMGIEQGTGDDRKVLLIDCGLMFPDADMHGIDLVLPDFTWLRENADRIVGVVATHGHEDHVGALQYLLRELSFPIYGSAVTLGLARNRIEEAGLLGRTELVTVKDGERLMIGPFDVEFIPVTHSVPHAHAIAVHTPQGVVLHTGDFKLDLTPVDGRRTDLARIGQLAASEGIRLLLADSTNAEECGYAPSETKVGAVLRSVFAEQKGRRIITASFASHLHRIQQIADAAIASGRVVATLGLSIKKNVRMGRDLGVLNIPDASLIDIEEIDKYQPGQVCIVSTGSQGEPMSALALLARGESKWVKVGDHDTVILSSHAIPGNEGNVNRVIDDLLRAGVEVVHSGVADVHATGHAQAEELKTYMSITEPEWFVPVHGEYHHLVAHARLAETMGTPHDHIVVAEDGDRLVLDDAGLRAVGRVPADYVYVHGTVGGVGTGVLADRRILADEGVVSAIVCIDRANKKIVAGPQITTRGWVHEAESGDLLGDLAERVRNAVQSGLDEGAEQSRLEKLIRKSAGSFVSDRTRRRPMIVPVVLEA